MKVARLFVLLFASQWMVPVSCSVLLLPTMHAASRLGDRDLQAGERPYLPLKIVMQEPRRVVLVELADVPAQHAAVPVRSLRLDGDQGDVVDGDRYYWRRVGAEVEVEHVAENFTHTYRYAVAADGTILPRSSRLLAIGHMFQAVLIAPLLAAGLYRLARWWRRQGGAPG